MAFRARVWKINVIQCASFPGLAIVFWCRQHINCTHALSRSQSFWESSWEYCRIQSDNSSNSLIKHALLYGTADSRFPSTEKFFSIDFPAGRTPLSVGSTYMTGESMSSGLASFDGHSWLLFDYLAVKLLYLCPLDEANNVGNWSLKNCRVTGLLTYCSSKVPISLPKFRSWR